MNTSYFPCAGSRAFHAPTRREFVYGMGASLGSVALTSLLASESKGPLAPKAQQVPAKAKNCIFLMMEGGPSHIDCFDPKPMLEKLHLKEFTKEGKMKSAMESGKRYYVKSPFKFAQHGQCGRWVSELLPHTSKVVDDIALIKTVNTTAINHDPACTFVMTGSEVPGRASLGSWLSYGLGSESNDLPAFVCLTPRYPLSSNGLRFD